MLTRGCEAKAHASPDTVLFPLPRCFVRAVFLLLPVDTRLRCCEVSRAWRALLADTTFFSRLNLSASSGVEHLSLPLLRAAVAKAGGQLRALDITGLDSRVFSLHSRFLLKVVVANAATLTELRVNTQQWWSVAEARALLHAAPALLFFEASIIADRDVARAMLRNEPPFQALRMRLLFIHDLISTADVIAVSSDLRVHASLERLILNIAALDTAAAIGVIVDACIALYLHGLMFDSCRLVPATLPLLTSLINAGWMRNLYIYNDNVGVFDEAHESTQLFVAAVRASAMTRLRLVDLGNVPESVVEAAALINARGEQ